MANEAVVPPVVGSARMEMKGRPAASRRAKAALDLAICIRDKAPSCMRAPRSRRRRRRAAFPEGLSRPRGHLFAYDRAMLPPMKAKSRAQTTIRMPPTRPTAVMAASGRSVLRWESARRFS